MILAFTKSNFVNRSQQEKVKENYALKASRCSQQLHAIANPSEEDVALPNSSTTIRLLQTAHKATWDIINETNTHIKD